MISADGPGQALPIGGNPSSATDRRPPRAVARPTEPARTASLARGGDRQSSRLLWQQMLASADNDWLRQQAALRLAQLDALDQIDQLKAAVEAYRARSGGLPPSWRALADAGLLPTPAPTDPAGTPYELDPQTGAVALGRDSRLRPLPVEPPGGEGSRP